MRHQLLTAGALTCMTGYIICLGCTHTWKFSLLIHTSPLYIPRWSPVYRQPLKEAPRAWGLFSWKNSTHSSFKGRQPNSVLLTTERGGGSSLFLSHHCGSPMTKCQPQVLLIWYKSELSTARKKGGSCKSRRICALSPGPDAAGQDIERIQVLF